ncbi:hypothetical protein WEB32_05225 [Streptomyces netropsis]|uniref:Uncharacterized protein n=1 Tax=Streptomyces netropsis TaxID=55404 RepID=A0A7W7LEY1_STRNE|nr:hypothetical protein [Streptomyces netropsis]
MTARRAAVGRAVGPVAVEEAEGSTTRPRGSHRDRTVLADKAG